MSLMLLPGDKILNFECPLASHCGPLAESAMTIQLSPTPPKGEAGDLVFSFIRPFIHCQQPDSSPFPFDVLCETYRDYLSIYMDPWRSFFSRIQIPGWPSDGLMPPGVKFHLHTVFPFPFGCLTWNIQKLFNFKWGPANLNLSSIRYLIWPPGCHLVFPTECNSVHVQYTYFPV